MVRPKGSIKLVVMHPALAEYLNKWQNAVRGKRSAHRLHACQSTERLWADRAASVRWPRKRGRAEIPLAMNSTSLFFPVSRPCLRLGRIASACADYTDGRKTGICARARARYPLDKFLGKAGILLFEMLTHSGEARRKRLLATGCYLQWKPALAAT